MVAGSIVARSRDFNLRWTPWQFRAAKFQQDIDEAIALAIERTHASRVLDVDAGRKSTYISRIKNTENLHLIGLDLLPGEMDHNKALDERLYGDACKSLIVPNGSIDVIACKSTVEHLPDTEAFLANVRNALRPGGEAVLSFPCKYAPFALLNRMLPDRVAAATLKRFMPGHDNVLGFETHYDRTHYAAFTKLVRQAGLEIAEERVVYWSSSYFAFFTPVYLASMALDFLRAATRIKSIASYYIFVLKRP